MTDDTPTASAGLLSEVGRTLQRFAVERFDQYGTKDVRGAAFWDAACYVVEQMGDGDWRREGGQSEEAPNAERP
jgi:hypothetical protein